MAFGSEKIAQNFNKIRQFGLMQQEADQAKLGMEKAQSALDTLSGQLTPAAEPLIAKDSNKVLEATGGLIDPGAMITQRGPSLARIISANRELLPQLRERFGMAGGGLATPSANLPAAQRPFSTQFADPNADPLAATSARYKEVQSMRNPSQLFGYDTSKSVEAQLAGRNSGAANIERALFGASGLRNYLANSAKDLRANIGNWDRFSASEQRNKDVQGRMDQERKNLENYTDLYKRARERMGR